MATNFEKRIAGLEQRVSRRKRPALIIFDERDHADPRAAADAYIAATPERELARHIVVVNPVFPRGELHGAERYPQIAPQAGSVADLLAKDSD